MISFYFNLLPCEIVAIIFENLSIKSLVFLNKYYYYKYNFQIPQFIPNYLQYIIDISRNDSIFIIKNILKNNFNFINNYKKISYKKNIFKSYFQAIYFFCKKYSSFKSIQYINYNYSEYTKEWLKNNPYKDNRWTS